MQTKILPEMLASEAGKEADRILRSCVHCGFCTATCPTYQVLGNELDGPRGRIYLIKDMLEGSEVTEKTRQHLDRCLVCRSCETTCPSGIDYVRLLNVGRTLAEQKSPRSLGERLLRRLLLTVLPHSKRFAAALRMGQAFRPLLPRRLKALLPASGAQKQAGHIALTHPRRMLLLDGCVQPSLAPEINTATTLVLDRLGISAVSTAKAGCCGALHHHMGEAEASLDLMRRNIDIWWPEIEGGAEAIVVTASACALEIKEYGDFLSHDSHYAAKARRVSELARDIAEILAAEDLTGLNPAKPCRIAFHSSCTLQHGLKLNGVVEDILSRLGYELVPVADAYLCCGAAGTYSLFQPELADELRSRKLSALTQSAPECIATANIGCLHHLQANADIPVVHWIELLAPSPTENPHEMSG